MAADDIDRVVDVEADQKRTHAGPPPDRPGAEDVPSRADSRMAAKAAGEAAVDDRDSTVSGETDGRIEAETTRSYAERLDSPIGEDQPTPREILGRFDPVQAGLPEITEEDAADYIARNSDKRPWLALGRNCDPVVQRVLAAMDMGQGHALERHEGYADDEKRRRRVTALEDPAQLDEAKRLAGIDGCKRGNRNHRCADIATAIQDPSAFVWVDARRTPHREPDVPEPRCSQIHDFRGARVDYFFRPDRERTGYEIATMYVQPSRDVIRRGDG